MVDITISDRLRKSCPYLRLGVIKSEVKYGKDHELLGQEIEETIKSVQSSLSRNQIADLPVIRHTREAYLALGKEPARYRCSAEALLRRAVQEKGLYRINNVVDIINLISLQFHFSIGCYDYQRLSEPITFDIAQDGETYQAIGRGTMKIAQLPVFRDEQGPFGSPTSDSERTMITRHTREVLIVIIDFCGTDPLSEAMGKTCFYLKEYAVFRNDYYSVIV
ncbi:MAG: hypothetical protein GX240_07485 [Candidatus Atribacteria bacterium]|nr:hypothetical protein [Candidatus Atribacteria bacterium]